jgi:alpha-beta hydrolase superfamily lysophospholipase
MKRIFVFLIKSILIAALLVATALLAWAYQSRGLPDLHAWHTVVLEKEFTASDATPATTLEDYLALEDRLFAELDEKIYQRADTSDEWLYSRYMAGGPQDPRWPTRNWNRTFELVPDKIRAGALLLHGLTDSPYSLRRVAEMLYAKGFYVLGLRLPGHGTIPGALTEVHWEDWVAASRIGARHVRERIGPDLPFLVVGYSNGGGLSVKYAMDSLTDSNLPIPNRLLLFSPEIGIEALAGIANSHRLLSFLPYFAKFKWLSIVPEYDPFKYNSFPKNAAQEAWEVTSALQKQIEEERGSGRFRDFPNVVAFLSWTDSTVSTSETINRLFDQLENNGSELIIFDVNRFDLIKSFIPAANASPLAQLEARVDLPYRLTIVSNTASNSRRITQRSKAPHSETVETEALALEWPRSVYSLSHVAVPFAPDDPVYGAGEVVSDEYEGLPLGSLKPRGETRLLTASLGQLMRLRYNPFFAYVEQRINTEIDAAYKKGARAVD